MISSLVRRPTHPSRRMISDGRCGCDGVREWGALPDAGFERAEVGGGGEGEGGAAGGIIELSHFMGAHFDSVLGPLTVSPRHHTTRYTPTRQLERDSRGVWCQCAEYLWRAGPWGVAGLGLVDRGGCVLGVGVGGRRPFTCPLLRTRHLAPRRGTTRGGRLRPSEEGCG
jgi:hypothetical protein